MSAEALLSMPLALLWTIGLMQLFGLKFNLANIWALPLLIGTSTEFGLTTIVGFGSLMVSRHQGIFDLGLLLTLGSVAGLLASLVALPAILQVLPVRAENERSGVAPQHG